MEIDFSHIATFISLIFGFSLMHAITVLTTYIQNSNKMKFNLDPIYNPDRPNEVKYATCSSEKSRKLLRLGY